jgi:hypothetical protein
MQAAQSRDPGALVAGLVKGGLSPMGQQDTGAAGAAAEVGQQQQGPGSSSLG